MARLSDSITYGNHSITGDLTVGGKQKINDGVITASTSQTAESYTFYNITAVITLTLPLNPAIGEWIRVSNFSSGNPILARNGSNIMGLAEDMTIDKANSAFTLTYVSSVEGWIIN